MDRAFYLLGEVYNIGRGETKSQAGMAGMYYIRIVFTLPRQTTLIRIIGLYKISLHGPRILYNYIQNIQNNWNNIKYKKIV